ncbi:HAD family hydrolase [Chromobacterium vaccinii]|uniref:HAD-IIB family hydrolase n=1 Tax=Chromobacterium vaccinii TaxID=1108595 RepID=UPI001E5170E3|nr:HAD family hydrolase [Chromobacterium vaccinii]MCD4499410.1 Cof-type HAD-IIB family hydrolase [Chromobacterium vaccinii]
MHFIFDIDGTLCFNGFSISPAIQDALAELEHRGHQIGFASARPYRDMLPLLDERFHDGLFVGSNGAMTWRRRALADLSPLPDDTLEQLFELTERHAASWLADLDWHYHYSGDPAHPFMSLVDPGRLARHVERGAVRRAAKLLVTDCEDSDGLQQALARRSDIRIHHHSDQQIVDITAAGVDKAAALARHGIASDEMVCFGNDSNDIPMFAVARHAVQVGEHAQLGTLATEWIARGNDTEEQLIATMRRLGERFAAT